jgi:hypothetical protein
MRTTVHPHRGLRIIAGCATLVLIAGLTACSSPPGSAADAVVGAPAIAGGPVDGPDAAAQAQSNVTTSTVTDRQVVRMATVGLTVADVTASARDVHARVAQFRGLVSNEDLQTTTDPASSAYATITAQIPAADLDAFITSVSALGSVESVTVSAQDVTSTAVDLDARIRALTTSITRLTQLLSDARQMSDLLAIETQLAQRQSELDAFTAQRTYLADQVAMSTVTVTLSGATAPVVADEPGFLAGLGAGWTALSSAIVLGVTAAGFLLPFLAIALIVAVPILLIIARIRRRSRRPRDGATSAHPAASEASAVGAGADDTVRE